MTAFEEDIVRNAWHEVQRAFHKDLQTKVNYEGTDWYQVTPEEQKVFGISLLSMRRVVTAYSYYEEILDLAHTDYLPPAVRAVIMKDVAQRFGMEPQIIDCTQFQKFARLFGISNRTAHAWYMKHEFWCVRRGIAQYPEDDDGSFLF